MGADVELREIRMEDLDALFTMQLDAEANHMAAFTAKDPADRAAFDSHWMKTLSDDEIAVRAIVKDCSVIGYVASFEQFGRPSISYWVARPHWGKGIATQAVRVFTATLERPLYARTAADNSASIRVLKKCGFAACERDRGFAAARNAEVDELIFRLDDEPLTAQRPGAAEQEHESS